MGDKSLTTILQSVWPNAKIKNKDLTQNNSDQQSYLDQIKEMIKQAELSKYPNPPFEAVVQRVSIDNPKHETDVFYVKSQSKKLSQDNLNEIRDAAIQVRKLNLVAGVLNAMNKSDAYFSLSADQKKTIEGNLFSLLRNSTTKNQSQSGAINEFVKEIMSVVKAETNVSDKEILRKIRLAERYFVAENNANRTLVFEHTRQNKLDQTTYFQIDVPMGYSHPITDKVKNEFLLVHDKAENHPAWFSALPKWEQDCIAHLVPKTLDGNWNQFIQSSAMQHLPGMKNSRINFFIETQKDDSLTILSKSIKTSTLVPYEMQKDLQEKAAELSAHQLLSALEKESHEKFNNKWGNVFATVANKPKPLVFVHSLLSDTTLGGADNHLAKTQLNTINNVKSQFDSVNVITGNEPVNLLRRLTTQSNRWKYVNEVLAATNDFFDAIPKTVKLNPEQIKSRNFIEALYGELNNLQNPSLSERFKATVGDRNAAAFKSAYLDIMVEELGGAVSTNCKSGKDRTGMDELYRHSIRVYYNTYKELPRISDKSEARHRFNDIFVELFNTLKTQEAAAMSTPGSFGLKDDAFMLCTDIAADLGKSYAYSNSNAAMNKPPAFMVDEKDQMDKLAEMKPYQIPNHVKTSHSKSSSLQMANFNRTLSQASLRQHSFFSRPQNNLKKPESHEPGHTPTPKKP